MGLGTASCMAPLGAGDGKQQVGVGALCLCLQRKHSLEQRVPRGLGRGELAETPLQRAVLAFAEQPAEISQAKSCEGDGESRTTPVLPGGWAAPGAELVSLGRRDRTPGSWAAWLTTCKRPTPRASPA